MVNQKEVRVTGRIPSNRAGTAGMGVMAVLIGWLVGAATIPTPAEARDECEKKICTATGVCDPTTQNYECWNIMGSPNICQSCPCPGEIGGGDGDGDGDGDGCFVCRNTPENPLDCFPVGG